MDILEETFDVLTAFHVLEHVHDPISLLKACGEKARILLIEVPNHSYVMMEASEAYRAFSCQRAHISYFTQESLTRAMKSAGFTDFSVRGVQRYGLENVLHWLEHGTPQKQKPSYEQAELASVTCDTLIAEIKVPVDQTIHLLM